MTDLRQNKKEKKIDNAPSEIYSLKSIGRIANIF